MNILDFVIPLIYVIAGLFSGLALEKFILGGLRRSKKIRAWASGPEFIGCFKGLFPVWCVTLGLTLALSGIPELAPHSSVIQKTLLIIVILSFTLLLSRIAVMMVHNSARKMKGVLPSTSIFTNLTRFLILLIGALIILQFLGISITPILTALGVGGLAVALALQNTFANLFSGLQILASGMLRPGQYIRLETGEEGYITDIGWRSTTIRSLPNNIIIIPNSNMASAIVTNYHIPDKELAVLVNVSVSYASDLEKVEKITIETAGQTMKEVTGGVPAFNPFIRYNEFGDSGVHLTVILRASEYVDQYNIKHEFIKRLHRRYQEEGIEIPYPARSVYIREKK